MYELLSKKNVHIYSSSSTKEQVFKSALIRQESAHLQRRSSSRCCGSSTTGKQVAVSTVQSRGDDGHKLNGATMTSTHCYGDAAMYVTT
jgi:hypothetical protein